MAQGGRRPRGVRPASALARTALLAAVLSGLLLNACSATSSSGAGSTTRTGVTANFGGTAPAAGGGSISVTVQ